MSTIREHCRESLLKAHTNYTDYVNQNRMTKDIKIGQRVFAKLDKYLHKQKLDLPITGPFIVMGRKGRALQLKEIATKRTYLVHPDYIVPSATLVLSKGVINPVQAESESVEEPPPSIMQSCARYNLRPRHQGQTTVQDKGYTMGTLLKPWENG
jgi:hypothetical protein